MISYLIVLASSSAVLPSLVPDDARGAIAAPVLKWQSGSCQDIYCASSWFSSVSVVDLGQDNSKEVVYAGYRINLLDPADGSDLLTTGTVFSRSWPSVAMGDLDDDGDLEIVTAHADGSVRVRDASLSELWSVTPEGSEVRSLTLADLDGDGSLEVVVGVAVGSQTAVWVYEHDGTLRPGWPQLSGGSGYGWGIYDDAIAVGDIDGDTLPEIVVPNDTRYVGAFEADGTEIPANAIYGGKVWGAVPALESLTEEIQGYGSGNVANFGQGAASITDLDGTGGDEVVVLGRMDEIGAPLITVGTSLFVWNGDRSRYANGSYDWTAPPVAGGVPLSEDYQVIEQMVWHPVTADLDGDGEKEVLYAASDGKVHAFWLDRTEHGMWPYDLFDSGDGYIRYASEPVVVDLDDDGQAEVIFSSWVEMDSGDWGRLYMLDSAGNLLHQVDLPAPPGSATWNGGLAAPTLAELDGDADLELLVNTHSGGVVAYDLPGSENAHVLWKTARGNDWRDGSGPRPVCGDGMREGGEECDDGNSASGDGCSSTCQIESVVAAPPGAASAYELGSAAPNPFNPSTEISYRLGADGPVELGIFDLTGRKVRTLVRKAQTAGAHSVVWKGRDDAGRRVASGVYLYRLESSDFSQTRRMVLLK
jgi:cysteine-rich repeat protein